MDRATRHTSREMTNHTDVIGAIVLVTLQEMLVVQQETKSVRSVGCVVIMRSVVRRMDRGNNLPESTNKAIRLGTEKLTM